MALTALLSTAIGVSITFVVLKSRSPEDSVTMRDPSDLAVTPLKGDPNDLAGLITREQLRNVRLSINENDCFTEEDLASFRDTKPREIARGLLRDPTFVATVLAIRELNIDQRTRLLKDAKKAHHRTWRQNNRIGPDGQTESGQRAEELVAEEIVRLVEQLVEMDIETLQDVLRSN